VSIDKRSTHDNIRWKVSILLNTSCLSSYLLYCSFSRLQIADLSSFLYRISDMKYYLHLLQYPSLTIQLKLL